MKTNIIKITEFAQKILLDYAKESNTYCKDIETLNPFEEWLIKELKKKSNK